MRTPITRRQHSREHQRYGSDPTDAERAIIARLLPPAGKTGRPRRWPMRDIINAILYVLRSGCPWRMVPESFAPRSTVYRWVHPATGSERVRNEINYHLLIRNRPAAPPRCHCERSEAISRPQTPRRRDRHGAKPAPAKAGGASR
jgi:transposase